MIDRRPVSGNNSFSGTTTFSGNLSAYNQTVTPTQLSYLSNTTSDIQTQLDSKVGLNAQNTFTARQQFGASFDCTGNAIFTGICKAKFQIAAWMFDGAAAAGKNMWPVFCSNKGFRPGDVDDFWVVMPGYTIRLYDGDNYTGGILQTCVNDTIEPSVFTSTYPNAVASIKVFYRINANADWTEITLPNIS